MIPSNVIHRVFRIRHGTSTGTAFTIDIANRQYLVTARHVVEALAEPDRIDLFSNDQWVRTPVRLVGHADGDIDISVLALNYILTPANLTLPATSEGIIYGQDVFFLGFPYGFLGQVILGPNGYPLPFVKKAILSQLDGTRYLLDGHNNSGFSGGPVVFTEPYKQEFKIASVVSGYQRVFQPVLLHGQPAVIGEPSGTLTYEYNTGIIVSYNINTALELIATNPIGCAL